jgi:outer membrane biosynthesis protein TonB
MLIACVGAAWAWPLMSQAATQQAQIPDKFKGMILNAPEPEYPLALERQTVRDQGVYRLKINQQNGGVDEVSVLMRCSDRRLDGLAVMTFFQWKFKPGTLKQIDIPVVYERFVRVMLTKALATKSTRK